MKLFDGALLSASTAGAGNAGKIIINAIESIILRGENGLEDDAESFIKSQVLEGARGNSRGIEINTGKLTLLQGAEISASTFGIGNSGKVIVNATESITLEQQNSLGESSET